MTAVPWRRAGPGGGRVRLGHGDRGRQLGRGPVAAGRVGQRPGGQGGRGRTADRGARSRRVALLAGLPLLVAGLLSAGWGRAGRAPVGVGGVFARLLAPRVLRRLYADELGRLDHYAWTASPG